MIQQFRLNEALKTIYSLIWDDFCSWYLEWVKPPYGHSIPGDVYEKTVSYFTTLLQLLHPFMPFVTEEIYHLLKEQKDDLCIKQFNKTRDTDHNILKQGDMLKEIITGLRDIRNKQKIKQKVPISLHIETSSTVIFKLLEPILAAQVNAKNISYTNQPVLNTITSVIGKDKFFIEIEQPVSAEHQKKQLLSELTHLQGFLVSVEKNWVMINLFGMPNQTYLPLSKRKKLMQKPK